MPMLVDFNLAKDYEKQTAGHFTDSLTGLYNYGFFRIINEVSIPADSSPKILIVDDDPRNVKLIRELIRPHDFQIFTAHDGDDALSIAKRISIDLMLFLAKHIRHREIER